MKRGRVRKRSSANRDLVAHADYIAQHNSLEMGERFLAEAEETFELLAQSPRMGSNIDFKNPLLEEVLKWRVSKRFRNHLLFYLPLADGIDVLYVFHAARNYQEILERAMQLPR